MKKYLISCAIITGLVMGMVTVSHAWWANNKTIDDAAIISSGAISVVFDGTTQRLTSPSDPNNKAILAALLTAISNGSTVDLSFTGSTLNGVAIKSN